MIDVKKIKKYYDHVLTQVYAEPESPMHEAITQEVWDNIISKLDLDKKSKILDVGAGPGYFLQICKKNGYKNITATVGTKEELALLKKKKFKAVIEDISFLSNKNKSLDMIFCRQVLEHSPWPYITLMEYNRVLKMGGTLYVECPRPDCKDRMHESNPNHYSVMGVKMLHNLIARAGFKVDQAYNLDMPIKNENTNESMIERAFAVVAVKEEDIPSK